jgi:signal transduction histidine kinase
VTDSDPVAERAAEDTADHVVIATDRRGVIVVFSAAAEQMLGYRAEDVIGKLTPAHIGAAIQRAHESHQTLLRALSHDLRTPLTGIQGFSEMIRDETWSLEEIKDFAADINRAAVRLDRMILEMLDVHRDEPPAQPGAEGASRLGP